MGWALLIALAALTLLPASARADDRPFVVVDTAVGEEDDDRVWSVETWALRLGPLLKLTATAEYAFDPSNAVQFDLTRVRVRDTQSLGAGVEVSYKHLVNRVARDGWGLGFVLSLDLERESGRSWRAEGVSLRVPASVPVGNSGALLHLNLGIDKAAGERRSFTSGLALEVPLFRRTTGLLEAAREADQRWLHAGLRHWIQRERFAIDFGLLQRQASGNRERGWVMGLSWFDL